MTLNSALPTGPRAHKAAMVAVNSTMLALGTALPPITLGAAVDGRSITLGDGPLLVAFICNHCPFVLHLRPVLVQRLNAWHQQGLQVIAISSNDPVTHPQDGPIPMAALAKAEGFAFPYFFDADQSLAKTFCAACTPDFFLFDHHHTLAYRGRFDATRPGNALPVTGNDLDAAVQAVLARQPVPSGQQPSIGCNIKWRQGNEPAWFPAA